MTSIGRTEGELDSGAARAPHPWHVWRDAAAHERTGVLRGLVHALSNRVGTVAAVAGLLDADAPPDAAVTVLRGEAERLEALLQEFRLLAGEEGAADGADGAAAAEPLHLASFVPAVVALHAHHPARRDVPCGVTGLDALPPVLAAPRAVADALFALLGAARGGVSAPSLAGDGEGDAVMLRVGGAGDGSRDVLPDAPLPGGGHVTMDATGGTLRLPTLAAARRGSRDR